MAADALAEGVVIRPLSLYYMNQRLSLPGMNLGFAGVPDEQTPPGGRQAGQGG